MTTSASRDQREYWNTLGGERWVRESARLDRVLEPLQTAALARAAVAPGERVVDVGCGCGASTLALGEAVGPSGRVLGIDLSGPMLGLARERSAGLDHVSFVEADAGSYAFPGDADLLFSRFGCMFFPEPVAAFANLERALRPGGRVCLMCWQSRDRNEWMALPLSVVGRFVEMPAPPAEGAPGPLSLSSADRVRELLGTAGFVDVELESHEAKLVLSSTGVADAVDFAMEASPAARALVGAEADLRSRVRDALEEALCDHLEGETVALRASPWIVTARTRGGRGARSRFTAA
jgi:SAM-dependent methyltransferase